MPDQTRVLAPGPDARTFKLPTGETLRAPAGWAMLPPGDPGATRRVKASGPSWTIEEKRGRKTFSRGVWADAVRIESVRAALAVERADPAHARKQESAARRRAALQDEYEVSFEIAVMEVLDFDVRWLDLSSRLSRAVAAHATPVGSGTVARTQRIPIEERAEAALFAWMRHQTTAYDDMQIARVKGLRREVRRELAQRSRVLLAQYRAGKDVDASTCPLQRALAKASTTAGATPLATRSRDAV